MSDLLSLLRLTARKLIRNGGFSLIVIVTLALGIGSTTAIFSVLYAVVLQPLPYEEPDRLVGVGASSEEQGLDHGPASIGDFVDWRRQARSFENLAAMGHAVLVLTEGGEPEDIPTAAVSASFFRTLGVQPFLGRDFLAEEETPGRDQVVLLSHSLWQRRFEGDPEVVGRQLELSGYEYVVIGVLPESFGFPGREIGFWAPMALDPENLIRQRRGMVVIGRLAPGATIEQARQEMGVLAHRLAEQYPDTNAGWGASVQPLHERVVRNVRPVLLLLLAATGLVLLIACTNVVSLLLTRAANRRREVAIRTAMGAGRWGLIRQLLTESLMLSLLGGGAGLALAYWGVRVLTAMSPGNVHRIDQVGIDASVLLFALGLSLVTGLVLGLLPSLWALRTDLQSTLKEGDAKGSQSRGTSRLGDGLIIAEVAVALLLLIGSGLLIRSFARLTEVQPGFDPGNLLVVNLFLPRTEYPQPPQHQAFFQSLLERIEGLPGVESAATTIALPMNNPRMQFDRPFRIPARPASTRQEPRAELRIVSPGYLGTMGVQLLRGRGLSERDGAEAPKVAVINESMARRFWPDEDPVGERFEMDYRGQASYEIVGVAGDVLQEGLDGEAKPAMYLSSYQFPVPFSSVVVRTDGDPGTVLSSVKAKVWELNDRQTITVTTMEENLASTTLDRRFTMTLLGVFAAVALVLTVIGVYGLVSFAVSRRTNEFGIRMALGASPSDVLRTVLGRGAVLTLIGVILGLAGAYFATRLLEGMLYGVDTRDLTTFLVATVLLIAVSLAGILVPAQRAMRVDPRSALLYE